MSGLFDDSENSKQKNKADEDALVEKVRSFLDSIGSRYKNYKEVFSAGDEAELRRLNDFLDEFLKVKEGCRILSENQLSDSVSEFFISDFIVSVGHENSIDEDDSLNFRRKFGSDVDEAVADIELSRVVPKLKEEIEEKVGCLNGEFEADKDRPPMFDH